MALNTFKLTPLHFKGLSNRPLWFRINRMLSVFTFWRHSCIFERLSGEVSTHKVVNLLKSVWFVCLWMRRASAHNLSTSCPLLSTLHDDSSSNRLWRFWDFQFGWPVGWPWFGWGHWTGTTTGLLLRTILSQCTWKRRQNNHTAQTVNRSKFNKKYTKHSCQKICILKSDTNRPQHRCEITHNIHETSCTLQSCLRRKIAH